jgi:hypothetical protein
MQSIDATPPVMTTPVTSGIAATVGLFRPEEKSPAVMGK